MSKAFTREDDDGGTALPVRSSALVPTERFHLTREGARQLQAHPEAHVRAALDLADILDPATPAERALLGVIVHARNASGERGLHPSPSRSCSSCDTRRIARCSPLGRALLGAEVGDVREIVTPRGREELEVLELSTDVILKKTKSVVKKATSKTPAKKTAAKSLAKTKTNTRTKAKAPMAKAKIVKSAKKPSKSVASARRTRAAS
jgi:transcription elongation GreA/GreB family factor